jgi:N6-adenosine-specific RNA methylase IME4
MKKLEDHPFASIFPLIGNLETLADDIKLNGLIYPITLFEDKILDGRNRYRACLLAEVEPQFVNFDNGDPISFVISSNALRRDLTQSQRAACAVNANELVESVKAEAKKRMSEGGKGVAKLPPLEIRKSRDDLAKLFGVAARYIQDALAIKRLGSELDELAKKKEPEWRELAFRYNNFRNLFSEVLNNDKTISDANRERERFEYDKRVAAAAIEKRALPQIIVADPPWKYDFSSTTPSRQTERQYDTLSVDEIIAQAPTPAPDSVLFLWATVPLLPKALAVMEGWGFEYKSCAIWDKEVIGLGNWFRIQHEFLLVGIRGKISPPEGFLLVSSIFRSKRRGHSEKPEEVFAWIDKAFPDMRKLEMYARKQRSGWSVWGNEV